ncbi:MAG: AAA family ATPase [Cyclobacteriaceae bacterium]
MCERRAQLDALHSKFNLSKENNLQLTLVRGEPGTGKSFLVEQFLADLEDRDDVFVSSAKCNAQIGQGNPYQPFKEIIEGFLSDLAKEGEKIETSSLKKTALFVSKALFEHAPDLIDLFMPGGGLLKKIGKYALSESGLQEKIQQSIEGKSKEIKLSDAEVYSQYLSFLTELSKSKAIVIFIDDLQWTDEASANLLMHLLSHLKGRPVYFLLSFRSNYGIKDNAQERAALVSVINLMKERMGDIVLDLDTLSNHEKLEFVSKLLSKDEFNLDDDFKENLIQVTNGNALFVTELIHSLQGSSKLIKDDSGKWVENGTIDWTEMPARVEAVVEERVERLETTLRSLLSQASVQGYEFLVQVISNMEKGRGGEQRAEREIERSLVENFTQKLEQEHRLVLGQKPKRKGRQILSSFNFSNAMVRQYLYNDLGESEKMYMHEDIAYALEDLYKDDKIEIAHLLAHHFEFADHAEKSIEYYKMAADHALRISAYREASILYQKALDQYDRLDENQETLHDKLKLMIDLSVALRAVDGWANERVVRIYTDAKNLGIKINDVADTAPVLFGLWVVHLVHLDLDKALANGEELVELGKKNDDEQLTIQAYVSLCNTYFWLGDLLKTKKYLDMANEMYDETKHHEMKHSHGQDPRSLTYMFEIMTLWVSGKSDEANDKLSESYDLMKELDHPFSLAIIICTASWLSYHQKDKDQLKKYNDELFSISEENGFTFYLGMAKMFQGYLTKDEALIDEGYKKDFLANGGLLFNSVYAIIKAEVALESGQITETTLTNLQAAILLAEARKEHLFYPELLRLFAIANIKIGEVEIAGDFLENALTFAKENKMHIFEKMTLETQDELVV